MPCNGHTDVHFYGAWLAVITVSLCVALHTNARHVCRLLDFKIRRKLVANLFLHQHLSALYFLPLPPSVSVYVCVAFVETKQLRQFTS